MPAHSRQKDGVASLAYIAGLHLLMRVFRLLMRVFRRNVLVGGFGAALAATLSHANPIRAATLAPQTRN
jgi:hypothetical protein